MVGADFVPAEGYGDPLRGTMAVLKLAQRHGARVLRGAEVQGIERDGAAWRVTTSKGAITAGRVVNATGPWAAHIGRMVGLDLPVTGTVQQVIVTEPAPPMTRHLIALAHRHLSLKQQASGGFLVGGGWFGGFDPASGRTHNLRRNIEGNLWVCARVLPVLRSLNIVRTWTGINPAIDRAPILGEGTGAAGLLQCCHRQRLHAGADRRSDHRRCRARRSRRSALSGGTVRVSAAPASAGHDWEGERAGRVSSAHRPGVVSQT